MSKININTILDRYDESDKKKILYSYEFAVQALGDKRRENGSAFIEHPLGAAAIVSFEMGLDADSIAVVFIHESIRFHPEFADTIDTSIISQDIIDMAIALNKIGYLTIKDLEKKAGTKEDYKQLIISYSKDPRAILVKLADRLDVMRNLKLLPKASQEKKINETILLYVPIAHQLGLYKIKSEFEEIFFKYTDKENYRLITNKLKATQKDRDKVAKEFIAPLEGELRSHGLDFVIKARTKTAYSIWKKMEKQEVPFEGVFDILAIRIIINNPEFPIDRSINKDELIKVRISDHELCWKAYSVVTKEYIPNTKRLRDWLSSPKLNGYESLHITVSNERGIDTEVQIRTKRMDDVAENGFASHWSYKGVEGKAGLNQWLQSVRDVLESDDKNNYEHTSHFVKENVFVFTPNGDLVRLKTGASVLDFAFNIHTNLGVKCSGAKIDGKIVSIREKLKTGDVVEILATKNQKPSSDWLNYAVTSKARSRIKQKIKEEETKSARLGRETLQRKLKNWKMEIFDEDVANLAKKYKCKSTNEFLSLIEQEKIDALVVKEYLKNKLAEKNSDIKEEENIAPTKVTTSSPQEGSDYIILGGKLNNLSYTMAKCCNPIYGDDVFGFVSIKEGIKIHRMSCPNAARLIENYPYRIQKVKWRTDINTSGFQVELKIIAEESSTYANVITFLNSINIPIRSSTLQEREGREKGFNIKIQISVSSNTQLDKAISGLKRIKGVLTVLRS